MAGGVLAVAGLLACWTVVAQEAPPAAPAVQETPAAPAPNPVLENTGKPIVLPFRCTGEDIQAAGLTCSEDEPCPVYLELSAVQPAGNRIVLAGNLHSAAVTLSSVLLVTSDEGHTWREAHERLRGATLEHIQFLDAETGWISGETMSPLALDPFLLLTTDGGLTWKQRLVLGDNPENRFGSVQQFSFSAKDSGTLVIDRGQGGDEDRYELYESPNAGESWTIKESSSKPLKLKTAPRVTEDWRLRADGPTQAYHVEHRQGQRWESVASFAVKTGTCKPE
jgi:hypothetical protein